MKKLFLLTFVALAATSCTLNGYLGNEMPKADDNSIVFSSGSKAFTKADKTGADAAADLNYTFVVEGVKHSIPSGKTTAELNSVFDNFNVQWGANTAGATTSNTSDWEYVGLKSTKNETQYIKYWDYSATTYNFVAYSLGTATSDKVTITGIELTGTDWKGGSPAGTTGAITLVGKAEDLAKCYITDMYTAYNKTTYAALTAAKKKAGFNGEYQQEVPLRFRSLGAKVRIGFYETIPGYSVKDVKFYNQAGTQVTAATLYNSTAVFVSGTVTAKVYYPNAGAGNESKEDYNLAYVKATSTTAGKDLTVVGKSGALDYAAPAEGHQATGKYMGRTSNTATYAGDPAVNYYESYITTGTGYDLNLKVDYTLVSNNSNGEVIFVKGATATIPAIYSDWKPNYAYTYLFKISDNTNGSTGSTTDPAGLYPITFDAVEVNAEDGTLETVTPVETNPITTYQKGKVVADNDEYVAGDIYAMVYGVSSLSATNAQLWEITNAATLAAAGRPVTEADVLDELNIEYSSTDGRNRLEYTAGTLDFTATEIPLSDGTDMTITAGQAAKFTVASSKTYAFIYKNGNDGTDTYIYSSYEVKKTTTQPSDWFTAGVWYLDDQGAHPVLGDPKDFVAKEEAPADWLQNWFTDDACTTAAAYYSETIGATDLTDATGWYSDAACATAVTDVTGTAGQTLYRKEVPATATYYKKHPFPASSLATGEVVYVYRKYKNNHIGYDIKVIKVK